MIQGKKILLVEDCFDNRLLLSRLLQLAGAHVEEAEHGQMAIEKTKGDHSFDLILMDLRMPVMDGVEATKFLRNSGIRIPIIALSAHVLNENMNFIQENGFSDYLTKPINRATLMSCLTACLNLPS